MTMQKKKKKKKKNQKKNKIQKKKKKKKKTCSTTRLGKGISAMFLIANPVRYINMRRFLNQK